MPGVVCVVQSRMGSSRLPGKALKPISGRQMLAHVLDRAKRIGGVARVVLATSINANNDPLTWIADDLGVASHRGDEHDVLGRFATIAAQYDADTIIRLTGDCPLLDPAVAETVLRAFGLRGATVAYVSNDTTTSGFPDGTDVEIMTRSAILQADRAATSGPDREHVTRWIRRHMPTARVAHQQDLSWLKLSVDCQEDLDRVRQVFGYLEDGDTSLAATVAAYRRAFPDGY